MSSGFLTLKQCNILSMEEDRYTRITLRIPRDLHERLQLAADRTSKSMNAEIVARLQASFDDRSYGNINFASLRKLLDRLDTEEKVIEASAFLESKKK